MAWVDDRIYCHPKVLRVSKAARWTYVAGVAYAAGWGTGGLLEQGALEAIGCEPRHRRELVHALLWDEVDGGVLIHDWDDHNAARDARRARERQRLREYRASKRTQYETRTQRSTDAQQTRNEVRTKSRTDAVQTQVEGSETYEGSTKAKKNAKSLATANNSQQHVAHFVDASRALGSDPPARVIGQIARLIGELVAEGVEPDRIHAGIDLLLERRLHPSALPSTVHEAAMPPPGTRRDGRVGAAEVMAHARQLHQEGR